MSYCEYITNIRFFSISSRSPRTVMFEIFHKSQILRASIVIPIFANHHRTRFTRALIIASRSRFSPSSLIPNFARFDRVSHDESSRTPILTSPNQHELDFRHQCQTLCEFRSYFPIFAIILNSDHLAHESSRDDVSRRATYTSLQHPRKPLYNRAAFDSLSTMPNTVGPDPDIRAPSAPRRNISSLSRFTSG